MVKKIGNDYLAECCHKECIFDWWREAYEHEQASPVKLLKCTKCKKENVKNYAENFFKGKPLCETCRQKLAELIEEWLGTD